MKCYSVPATSNSYAAMVAFNSVSKFNDYLQLTFPQDLKRTISGIIHKEFANRIVLKEDLIQISTSGTW